jgi:16S rRNA processing protein RimM
MGQIAGPYGLKGWVRVKAFTETLRGLLGYPIWQIGKQGRWRDVQVEDADIHGQSLVAKLAGCNDRDAAFALRGQEISVFRDEMPDTATGEYYWEDLIGLAVINRQGIALGEVRQLIETGAHDVLVVKDDKEHLIPFVDVYVLNVDLAQGRIEVDWGPDY